MATQPNVKTAVVRIRKGKGVRRLYARWTHEETRLLLGMKREGLTRAAIGRVLRRTEKSIKHRLEALSA